MKSATCEAHAAMYVSDVNVGTKSVHTSGVVTDLASLVQHVEMKRSCFSKVAAQHLDFIHQESTSQIDTFDALLELFSHELFVPHWPESSADLKRQAVDSLFDSLPQEMTAEDVKRVWLAKAFSEHRDCWREALLNRLKASAHETYEFFSREFKLVSDLTDADAGLDKMAEDVQRSDDVDRKLIHQFEMLWSLSGSSMIDWNDRRGYFEVEQVIKDYLAPAVDEDENRPVRFGVIFKDKILTDVLIDRFDTPEIKYFPLGYLSFLLGKVLDECCLEGNNRSFYDWSMAATALVVRVPDFDLDRFCLKHQGGLMTLLSKAPKEDGMARDDKILSSWFELADWNDEKKMFCDASARLLSSVAPLWNDNACDVAAKSTLSMFTCKLLAHLAEKVGFYEDGSLLDRYEMILPEHPSNTHLVEPEMLSGLVQRAVKWDDGRPSALDCYIRWLCLNADNRIAFEEAFKKAIPQVGSVREFVNILAYTQPSGGEFSLSRAEEDVYTAIKGFLADATKDFRLRARCFEHLTRLALPEAENAERWFENACQYLMLAETLPSVHLDLLASLLTEEQVKMLAPQTDV